MTHILVVGNGGREHAIAWKLARSPRVDRISVAPGNGGTHDLALARNVDIDATDIVSLLEFAEDEAVDLTIVGPEEPLAMGLVDQFEAAGLRIFGPCRDAAMIEASKSYAKQVMLDYGVPTAAYQIFESLDGALEYVTSHPITNLVIKANGLARGKGVFLPRGEADAEGILRALLERDSLGAAGHRVIIEKKLEGPEISIMAFTDGETLAMMPPVSHAKRLRDNDLGPNTGGMGAFAPTPAVSADDHARIEQEIVRPILDGLRKDHCAFKGVLNIGVVLTPDGPLALELNVRFGDPAAQTVLPLLETDLLDVIEACVDGALAEVAMNWSADTTVSVVLATAGYPERSDPGLPIILAATLPDDVLVFHAGTRYADDGALVTTGGRVLNLTGVGPDLTTALTRAYDAARRAHFDGIHFRTDIGLRAMGSK